MSGYVAFYHAEPTPTIREDRVLRVQAASFPRRLGAAVADVLLIGAVATVVTALAGLALGIDLPTAKQLGPDLLVAGILDRNPLTLGALGLFVGLGALYQIYLGGIVGQTLGKRWFGLRVISSLGMSLTPTRAIARYGALLLAVLPAGLGWVWCLFDRERRGAHDHLTGTYVIRTD